MSIVKFLITNGQEDKAHVVDRYVELDRTGTHVEEGQVKLKLEKKRQVMGNETGPEVLLKEHQQLVKPQL